MQLECFFHGISENSLRSYYTASAVIFPAFEKKMAFPYHQARRGTGERLTVLCRGADRYQTAHGRRSICQDEKKKKKPKHVTTGDEFESLRVNVARHVPRPITCYEGPFRG